MICSRKCAISLAIDRPGNIIYNGFMDIQTISVKSDSLVPVAGPDAVALLLADKRSPATQRAYKSDFAAFFGPDYTAADIKAFLLLSAPEIAFRLATYKAEMLGQALAENTVNRRLTAIRSLLKFAYRLGLATTDGRSLVDNEKTKPYRDTRGIDLAGLRRLLELPGTDTVRGLRDTALLRLLAENALRRAEVCALSVSDFDATELRLQVTGKGRGSQKEPITLSQKTADAVSAYLLCAGTGDGGDGPLFRNLDHRPGTRGGRLTADGLYYLIENYGKRIGFRLSPHRMRHSAITAALEATGGDVRMVQKLSRHADLRTLQIYDDNREDRQGQVTRLLSSVL